jgi:putative ABC transport system permease protein
MSLWRHLTRGLRVLTNRAAADEDVADELQDYLEHATAALEQTGLSPEDARRSARLEVGNAAVIREQVRSYGWESMIETLLGDLRYGVRQLWKNAGFASTAILILALGIGATTAIFSAVNPILFQPLPYPHPARIMMISELRDGGSRRPNFGTFRGLAERTVSFDAISVMKPWQPAMVGIGEPELFEGQRVSASYFRALGVLPALGREFQVSDDAFNGPNVVILSDRLWHRSFNADPGIIGRQITLENNSNQLFGSDSFTVIGVMPSGFENVLSPSAELWAPLQYDPSLPSDGREWGHHLRMVARLKSGVSRQEATSELDAILPAFAKAHAKGFEGSGGVPNGMLLRSLHDDLIAGVKPALLAILGAVCLVLLIASVNVTNLLLARGAQRRGEFAMRAALGAGQGRLLRQLITESLLLAVIGGSLGIGIAEIGVRAIVAVSPAGLPRLNAIRVDTAVLIFALLITTCLGLVVGLIPAIQASRSDPQSGLRQMSRQTAGGQQAIRRSLVVSEVALALVLLVSAGLLLRSLQRLFSVDPGFGASHVLTMQVQESGRRYAKDDARARLFKEALEAVRQVPGVTSAAFVNQLPLSGDYEVYGIEFEAYPNDLEPGFRYAVTPDYFKTMQIPLRRGRLLDEGDRPGAPVAVVISESFAKRKFPDRDAIGQRVRMGPNVRHADKPWATIVGVVGDVKQLSLGASEPDAFYTTSTQWDWVDTPQSIVVRARGDAGALAPAVRSAIWSVDKDQPIIRIATMESLLAQSEAQRRFALILFEAFALVALTLAATGLYGVLSGSVTERMREIGVRSALGASRSNILALVVRQGMTLTVVGVAIGLTGAVAASQAIITLLFGISRLDPITYVGVMALLLGVSGIACSIPAWRASRVDPAITLRAE